MVDLLSVVSLCVHDLLALTAPAAERRATQDARVAVLDLYEEEGERMVGRLVVYLLAVHCSQVARSRQLGLGGECARRWTGCLSDSPVILAMRKVKSKRTEYRGL